jgi:hypothetical protein
MNAKRILTSVAILAVWGVLACTASAVAAPSSPSPKPPVEKRVLHYIGLDHAVSLQDAASLGSATDEVVGFHYENPGIVGEYFTSSEPIATFLKNFAAQTGTAPKVVSIIGSRAVGSAQEAKTVSGDVALLHVPTSMKVFSPDASTNGANWTRMQRARSSAVSAISRRKALGPLSVSAVSSYQPAYAQYGTSNQAGIAGVWQYFNWSGGYNPNFRDPNFGLEFKVFQSNPDVFAGVRPLCADAYGNPGPVPHGSFWAQNQSFNWTIYYNPTSAGSLGAYADYNDAFDGCRIETIGVGIRWPDQLTYDGYSYEVAINIEASRGSVNSSKIGAYIHQVESYSCNAWPWNGTASTDCMGLNQNVAPTNGIDNAGSHVMLNVNRNFSAPNSCWETFPVAQLQPNGANDTINRFDCTLLYG